MNTGIILETEADRTAEKLTVTRFANLLPYPTVVHRLPDLSRVDYFLSHQTEIKAAAEIKTRKQTRQQIQQYGGLMMKHRKIIELNQLADQLDLPVWLIIGFDNGRGEIHAAQPRLLTDLAPCTPPTRRNYRGLACDDEPVVYLDWTKDLKRVA